MTKDEALNLALEALKGVLDDEPKVLEASISGGLYEVVQCRDAITAINEALAQPAQEPFGWYSAQEDEFMTDEIHKEHERLNSYTHIHGKFDLALYTTPPQRPWVDEAAIRANEREACSKMLENTDLAGLASDPKLQAWVANLLFAYAKAIRARGNT